MNQHFQSVPDCGRDSPANAPGAQKTLREFERQAWKACEEIAGRLGISGSTAKLAGFLAGRALPAFVKIGIDEAFLRVLFSLAPEAWAAADAASDNIIRLQPEMEQDLAEVRRGLLIQAERKMALRSKIAGMIKRLQRTLPTSTS